MKEFICEDCKRWKPIIPNLFGWYRLYAMITGICVGKAIDPKWRCPLKRP